jgi:hypothetical protein
MWWVVVRGGPVVVNLLYLQPTAHLKGSMVDGQGRRRALFCGRAQPSTTRSAMELFKDASPKKVTKAMSPKYRGSSPLIHHSG